MFPERQFSASEQGGNYLTLSPIRVGCRDHLPDMLAGFETPHSGDIRLTEGVLANSTAHRVRRGIGLVFQNRALPNLTVGRTSAFRSESAEDLTASKCTRTRKCVPEDLVRLSGLEDRGQQLSGGQPAAVLANRPRTGILNPTWC